MSLINSKEKQLIKDIADRTELVVAEKDAIESYFLKREDVVEKMSTYICEYDFDTPMELQNILSNMWEDFSNKEMMNFATVCSVAAFKNRKQESSQEISAFIYEF